MPIFRPTAPRTATYVLEQSSSQLPNARQLVAGTNVSLADAGPGKTLTINATSATSQAALVPVTGAFYISPHSGSDAGLGTLASPFKTFAKLYQTWGTIEPYCSGCVEVHLLDGQLDDTDRIWFQPKLVEPSGSFFFIGTPQVLCTGTMTGVSASSTGAADGRWAATLGNQATGSLSLRGIFVKNLTRGSVAAVSEVLAGSRVAVTFPFVTATLSPPNIPAYTTAQDTSWLDGDAYQLIQMPAAYVASFQPSTIRSDNSFDFNFAFCKNVWIPETTNTVGDTTCYFDQGVELVECWVDAYALYPKVGTVGSPNIFNSMIAGGGYVLSCDIIGGQLGQGAAVLTALDLCALDGDVIIGLVNFYNQNQIGSVCCNSSTLQIHGKLGVTLSSYAGNGRLYGTYTLWVGGQIGSSAVYGVGNSTITYESTAAGTFLGVPTLMLDGIHVANANDYRVSPVVTYPSRSLTPANIDAAISSVNGFGGTALGVFGSTIGSSTPTEQSSVTWLIDAPGTYVSTSSNGQVVVSLQLSASANIALSTGSHGEIALSASLGASPWATYLLSSSNPSLPNSFVLTASGGTVLQAQGSTLVISSSVVTVAGTGGTSVSSGGGTTFTVSSSIGAPVEAKYVVSASNAQLPNAFVLTASGGTSLLWSGSTLTVSSSNGPFASLSGVGGTSVSQPSAGNWQVSSSVGAPPGAAYLLLSASTPLGNARLIAAGSNVTFADGGPGGTLTISATGGGTTTAVTGTWRDGGNQLLTTATLGVSIDPSNKFPTQYGTDQFLHVSGAILVPSFSVGTFTPRSISNLAAWWEADTVILNGSLVSASLDKSGNGDFSRDMVQATVANQPVYNASDARYGGRPTIDFQSSTDVLGNVQAWQTPPSTQVSLQPGFWFIVGHTTSSSGARYYLMNLTAQTYLESTSATNLVAGATSQNTNITTQNRNAPGLLWFYWNNNNGFGGTSTPMNGSVLGINSVTASYRGLTGVTTADIGATFYLGNANGGGANLAGPVACVLLYSKSLADYEIGQLVNWANSRFGLTATGSVAFTETTSSSGTKSNVSAFSGDVVVSGSLTAMSGVRWQSQTFYVDSTWVSPITGWVMLEGCGGGGGGAGGSGGTTSAAGAGGAGGGGAQRQTQVAFVVAGLSYAISIGLGGLGGTAGTATPTVGALGQNGGDTTFTQGATMLVQFPGAAGGSAPTSTTGTSAHSYGGGPSRFGARAETLGGGNASPAGWLPPGTGGDYNVGTGASGRGDAMGMYSGGTNGTGTNGAGGGGAGGYGNGANAPSTPTANGNSGLNAADNTGGGGSGGTGGGTGGGGNTLGGKGGTGGSGQLTIRWIG